MAKWATSRVQRIIVGTLERHELVLDALREHVRAQSVRSGRIEAWGTLEDVQIALFESGTKKYVEPETLAGTSEVVHFHARVAVVDRTVHMDVTVAVARDGDVIAGRLDGGRVGHLEVAIESWDDLDANNDELRMPPPAPVAMPARRAVNPTPAPQPMAPREGDEERTDDAPDESGQYALPQTLAEAAQALEAMPDRHIEEPKSVEPEPGDLLEHPSFGIVEFEEEGDGGRARIKLSTGSRREIMLEVFDVQPREPLRGKRFFVLKPRRR